jgi:hypothetical protein
MALPHLTSMELPRPTSTEHRHQINMELRHQISTERRPSNMDSNNPDLERRPQPTHMVRTCRLLILDRQLNHLSVTDQCKLPRLTSREMSRLFGRQ